MWGASGSLHRRTSKPSPPSIRLKQWDNPRDLQCLRRLAAFLENPMITRRFATIVASGSRWLRPLGMGLLAAALASPAAAGVMFRLDRAQAAPGETVQIEAVYFNDGANAANWKAPRELVLQWRDTQGNSIRSLAQMAGDAVTLTVPVNNFARVVWQATVPAQAQGLQAVAIEGEPVLMALDASRAERSTVAGTPAPGPVVDATTGAALPAAQVAALGASPTEGPAVVDARPVAVGSSTFDYFRSAVSAYEPVYFSLGTRERTNAKFQISLKYRFFQPPESRPARFYENIYLGYTQTSLWDLDSDSKPFYDTSYRPSLFWGADRIWTSPGARFGLGMASGFEHESNGKSGEESRSLNTLFVAPALSYRLDGGSTISFTPKVKKYFDLDENPDIARYRGYVDWQARWAHDDGTMVSALLRRGNGHGSTQVDMAWPLRNTWLSSLNGYLHMQYFNGYGESLLDYNKRRRSQFRMGLMIVQ
jgi:outer membrane phospholipase A